MLAPTGPFFLQIVFGIAAAPENRTMVRFGLLQNEDLLPIDANYELVAGLEVQSFAGLAGDDDLVFGR